ncbi:MAG: UDP-N-acetylmuramate dehydrogenase [Gammaproteobacteria bacterium]|jgi:UDP-N-acetylmuramate dehydrogenase|nr:UDP-N-acetylmuramate dehydrogenase [Gammaproteobacteria bacterium]
MEAMHLTTTAISIRGELRYNEPMSSHTSWRAGGLADRYCIPADIEDLAMLLKSLPENENLLWLGLGSNTLVRDGGFHGTVIATQGVMSQLERKENNCVYVGAGVAGAKLARFCEREHFAGAEFFAGIPGLIGGALAMNAGAFGNETWWHVVQVETINRQGEIKQRSPDEYKISYRSVEGPEDEWFVAALLKFDVDTSGSGNVKQLLAKRAETQPTGTANCGSVFRNPDNDYAARLIEQCGLKGKRIGGAVVSEKHATFIINNQQATAEDIESLIEFVQKNVMEQTGVNLQTEVHIVGERLS